MLTTESKDDLDLLSKINPTEFIERTLEDLRKKSIIPKHLRHDLTVRQKAQKARLQLKHLEKLYLQDQIAVYQELKASDLGSFQW